MRLLRGAGFFRFHHRAPGPPNHRSFLLKICAIGRVGLLLLPVVIIRYGLARPEIALFLVLFVYSIFWLGDGAGAVSWFDIVAKTIPARVRGRFFGSMQALTGVLAIGSGYAVSLILSPSGLKFPFNFALLACCLCAGMVISQIALCFIQEPAGVVNESQAKPGFVDYMRRAPELFRSNPRLARLIVTRVLLDSYNIAAPFYILFAQRELHLTIRIVGICALLQATGRICGGPLWGGISDRFGPSRALQGVALAILAMPLLALGARAYLVFPIFLIFFVQGAIQDGLWMVGSNALLELVDDETRPFAVGLSSVFQTPSAAYGLIGGLVAQLFSYQGAFGCSLVIAVAGCVSAAALASGHKRRSALED